MRAKLLVTLLSGAALLGGCMVARQPAPVEQRTPEPVRGKHPASAAARDETYTVKRGDMLYGIALDNGIDYRDLARWNGITNPATIEVGQVLRLRDPAAPAPPAVASAPVPPPPPPAPGSGETVVTPYQAPPPVQGKAMGTEPLPPAAAGVPPAPGASTAPDSGIITAPAAIKLPYSQAALARLQETPAEAAPAPPAATAPAAPAATAPPAAPERAEAPAAADDPDAVSWGWPTKGKIIAGFNENGGPKGVQIAGTLGQAIVASAPGRVVYTGSGLRGYGNLVIIKHNNTYLSAYAHNRSVLVKQGDTVTKGQKIAEMGDSDASRVMLHFEIRRMGKPVDPIKFLPPG
jgi:lipoprotein NlpD